MNESPAVEMPRYRCHKEVHAAKITSCESTVSGFKLEFGEIGGTKEVSLEWTQKHLKPSDLLMDGYYVVYSDGYSSWSPAKAFEDGYTRI